MKKILMVALLLVSGFTTYAQRVAYVDVATILGSMSEYKTAQKNLDQAAEKWQQEITAEYQAIEEMYRRYQAEQVLLSDQARQQREEEIIKKEEQVRALQQQRFGPEGELFQKRQQLVKPIQDKVFGAIQQYATDKGLDIIFDKSAGAGIIFAGPNYDKTDDILDYLGVKKSE